MPNSSNMLISLTRQLNKSRTMLTENFLFKCSQFQECHNSNLNGFLSSGHRKKLFLDSSSNTIKESGMVQSIKLRREPKKGSLSSGAINVITPGVLTMVLLNSILPSRKTRVDSLWKMKFSLELSPISLIAKIVLILQKLVNTNLKALNLVQSILAKSISIMLVTLLEIPSLRSLDTCLLSKEKEDFKDQRKCRSSISSIYVVLVNLVIVFGSEKLRKLINSLTTDSMAPQISVTS